MSRIITQIFDLLESDSNIFGLFSQPYQKFQNYGWSIIDDGRGTGIIQWFQLQLRKYIWDLEYL